jgi:hypothetical protein
MAGRFFTRLNFPMGTLFNGVKTGYNSPSANRVYCQNFLQIKPAKYYCQGHSAVTSFQRSDLRIPKGRPVEQWPKNVSDLLVYRMRTTGYGSKHLYKDCGDNARKA